MTDRGFLISDDLEIVGVSLNIPAFVNGHDQLTKAEVEENQAIASVRIQVERAIWHVKKISPDQEGSHINTSRLNKSNVESLCLII